MELMAEGTYDAVTKSAVLFESKQGALMCVFDIVVEGRILKAWITLVQKDGTVSERGLKNVQDVMGWTGWDWAAFEAPADTFGGRACSVVIETAPDNNGHDESKIKWLNAPGGGMQRADAKTMAAKYSAKFRAVLGGATPAARPAAAKPLPQPTLPRRDDPPRPPVAAAGVSNSTMDACWAKLCEVMADKPKEAIEGAWFRLIEKIGGGKEQADLLPADWGQAMALISSVKPDTATPAAAEPPVQTAPEPPAADEDDLPF